MEKTSPHNDDLNDDFSFSKQNNFNIPEGYFDQLGAKLEKELRIENLSPKKGVVRMLIINVSIAAAVIIGVFLFNPEKKSVVIDQLPLASMEIVSITVDELMISMVESTEEWSPLDNYSIELTTYSEEEIEAVEIPFVDEVNASDITDLFEDDDYYEL